MNRLSSVKFLVAAALATAASGAVTAAEARPDVFLSVGFRSFPAYAEPAPVYVQQGRVFVEPAPNYARPRVFVSPREVFEGPRFDRYQERDWERERAWRRAEWLRHERHEEFRGRDRDHDHDHRHYQDYRD